ncbi:MAG: protein TolR [Pseudomonadota bacterium]
MSISMGNNKSLMSEINVTPMVDVMLVLLIIFMVTAPMMVQGMDVKLPQVDTAAIRTESERVVVTMNTKGQIFIDDLAVPLETLEADVKRIMENRNTQDVYLRADQDIPYGQVAAVMGAIREAGVGNLGLVTEPEAVAGPEKK